MGPIPIVKQGNEWRFDVEAGKVEMQARLIGRNELAVIQTLLAIVDAQRDYAAADPMISRMRVSSIGRRAAPGPGAKGRLRFVAGGGIDVGVDVGVDIGAAGP